MQTVALARALDGHITAVDLHEEYLQGLRSRAAEADVHAGITAMRVDMADLPFDDGSFDLIWSEGAAYVMGVAAALTAWCRFLRPGGYLALSELVWARPDPPAEVHDFFHTAYPAMTDVEGNLARFRDARYEVVAHVSLP